MSGETIEVWNVGVKVLEPNGSAVPNGSVAPASVGQYDKMALANGYPHAQFVLTCQFSTAPVEGSQIALYALPMNLDANGRNAQTPESTRPTKPIGVFTVNDVTTVQTMELMAYDIPRNAWYYLHNVNTGQSVPLGWTLSVNAMSYKPAP